jgi:hypothetical protein
VGLGGRGCGARLRVASANERNPSLGSVSEQAGCCSWSYAPPGARHF